MFSFMLLIFHTAMVIAVISFIPVIVSYRIYIVLKNKFDLKKSLKIILIPLSLGYILYLDKDKKTKTYNILIYIYVSLAVIGIIFTIYQRYLNFI